MKPINTGTNWNSCEQFQRCPSTYHFKEVCCSAKKTPPPKWQWSRTSAHHVGIPVDSIMYRQNWGSCAVYLYCLKNNSCKSGFLLLKKTTFVCKTASYEGLCSVLLKKKTEIRGDTTIEFLGLWQRLFSALNKPKNIIEVLLKKQRKRLDCFSL